jgi:hypothetical protein
MPVGQLGLLDYVMHGDTSKLDNGEIQFTCNSDAMFHMSKGVYGIRINGVLNTYMSDIEVRNIKSHSEESQWWQLCGDYLNTKEQCSTQDESECSIATTTQQPYILGYGFPTAVGVSLTYSDVTMNVDNFVVDHVVSWYGDAHGIDVFYSVDDKHLKFERSDESKQLEIKNIYAGTRRVYDSTQGFLNGPNKTPEACAFRGWTSDLDSTKLGISDETGGESPPPTEWDFEFESGNGQGAPNDGSSNGDGADGVIQVREKFVAVECVSGHVLCLGEDVVASLSQFDDYSTSECQDARSYGVSRLWTPAFIALSVSLIVAALYVARHLLVGLAGKLCDGVKHVQQRVLTSEYEPLLADH